MDKNFKNTLYTMMQDLKFALEGGQKMDIEEMAETPATNEVVEGVESEAAIEETVVETENVEEVVETEENMDNGEQSDLVENDNSIEVESNQENFSKQEEETEDEDKKEDYKECKNKKDYSLLESQYSELQTAYSELETKYQALVEFKKEIDNEKKDALIQSFYMLSEEDKADVIANKENYSLDDIESKLSVICVRKKVNFEDETSKKENVEEKVMTYNLNGNVTSTPAWIAALKNTRNSRK